ncbi:MAG: ComF family protein [bacterium]
MNFRFFLDLLFPIECISCGKDNFWLCGECLDNIKLLKEWHCPVCKAKLTNGYVCKKCSSQSFLDGAVIAVFYDDKLIDKAIHYLKYKGIKDLAKPLGKLLARALNNVSFWQNDWILVPVPLHKRRERFRGFNQAGLIADEVAKILNLEVEINNLCRFKHTRSQMKLKRDERLKNVVGAFGIKNPAFFAGKKIILIDDVMTTGATLQECARTLKSAGAVKIWAAAGARGK